MITIYGLFEGKRCRYIGQTLQPYIRSRYWKRHYPKLKWIALKSCEFSIRFKEESKAIKFYRGKGQCDLNFHEQGVTAAGTPINRTTLSVSRALHRRFSEVARMLGLSIKDAFEQAVRQWTVRNARRAHKKASELIKGYQ